MRPYLSGRIGESIEFKLEAEFAGPGQSPQDAYIRLKRLPRIGDLTVGNIKEPFGLEILTSSRDITFMERALPTTGLAPGRNPGIMVNNYADDERTTWALGCSEPTMTTAAARKIAGTPWR
jgi:phosphate-selective porin OprO and OprP